MGHMNITVRMRTNWKKKERKREMSRLYELTGDYLALMEMLEDAENDGDAVFEALGRLQGEIEEKADAYAKIIQMLNGSVETYKAEEARLAARRKAIEGNVSRLKRNLEECMLATDNRKFKTGLFSFGIQKNPPSLVIDNLEAVPEQFLIPQPPKVDSGALKKLLNEQAQPYAHLEQSESIRIR